MRDGHARDLERDEALIVGLPPGPRSGAVVTRPMRELSERLASHDPVVWVLGPPGGGRTTAVAYALAHRRDVAGICRIGFQGLRLEEGLAAIGVFLRQLGHPELYDVLEQRSAIDSKLAVLAHVIREVPVIVWWDDVDRIAPPIRGRGESPGLQGLVERIRARGERPRGALILTSKRRPLAGFPDVETVALSGPTSMDSIALWASWGGDPAEIETALVSLPRAAPRREILPLHLRLALEASRAGSELTPASWIDPSQLDRLVRDAGAALSPGALALLERIAAHVHPIGRRALKLLGGADGEPLSVAVDSLDSRLVELADRGWIELEPERGRWFCGVSPTLSDAIERWCEERDETRWRKLIAAAGEYHADAARRAGDWWLAYRAYAFLARAGRKREAHQVTRFFIENLLRYGYFDLGQEVLEKVAEEAEGAVSCVALGNLAIIAKSRGDHDKALELYLRARSELERLGDWPNVARILHQIGNTLYLKSDLQGALGSYEESLRLSIEHHQPAIATATKVQIANVFWSLGRFVEARERYEEAAVEIERSGDRSLLAAVYLQLGQIDLRNRRAVEAEASFRRAVERAMETGDRRNVLKALRGLALVAQETHDRERARSLWQEAERTALLLGDWAELADCRLARGDLESRAGRFGAALAALEEALVAVGELERAGVGTPERLSTLRQCVEDRIAEAKRQAGEPDEIGEIGERGDDPETSDGGEAAPAP